MDDFQFRPCTPVDVKQAIPLIISTGPQAFSYVFDTKNIKADDFLTYAFQKKGGEFSFQNHYALIIHNELIGIGAIFDYKSTKRFIFYDILRILIIYGFKIFNISLRGLKIQNLIKPSKQKEITLAHIAIHKKLRGQGFGTKLVAALIKQSQPKSEEYFVLDVSEKNPRAIKLYSELGFKVKKCMISKLHNLNATVPNHFRMELHQI